MWSSAALRATSTTFPEVQTFTRRNLRGEKLIVHDVSEGALCENYSIYRVFEGVLCEHTIIYDACQSLIIWCVFVPKPTPIYPQMAPKSIPKSHFWGVWGRLFPVSCPRVENDLKMDAPGGPKGTLWGANGDPKMLKIH